MEKVKDAVSGTAEKDVGRDYNNTLKEAISQVPEGTPNRTQEIFERFNKLICEGRLPATNEVW